MSEKQPINKWFDVTADEVKHLFDVKRNPAGLTKFLLIVVAGLLSFFTPKAKRQNCIHWRQLSGSR
jgi:hypothetical protein